MYNYNKITHLHVYPWDDFCSFQVASNPYHYNSHVELVKLLRESGDLDKVRNAREEMSKIFPLTQGIIICKSMSKIALINPLLPDFLLSSDGEC